MSLFDILAILITLAALFSFINYKLLKLPTTIGLMVISLIGSTLIIALGKYLPSVDAWAHELAKQIDFNKTLMNGMLGFLLFAGALHVNLTDLTKQKWVITLLSTLGVLISTAIVGGATWLMLQWINFDIKLSYCLIFGALITPTDPIAVLGIIKTLGAPKSLETKIAGESLFNDGMGVVVFMALLGLAGLESGHTQTAITMVDIVHLFGKEVLGGAAWGLLTGTLCYYLLRATDNYQVEILLSLALVMGSYTAAAAMGISGPIAMVICGLLIGNHGRRFAMSSQTRKHLDMFWKLIDQILNAVLFVLIGLEVLVLSFKGPYIMAGLLAVPIALLGRMVAVGLPVLSLKPFRRFSPHAIKILTWSGLRGGISVALALSLRDTLGQTHRQAYMVILFMTYMVVSFSIICQGLTLKPLMKQLELVNPPATKPH